MNAQCAGMPVAPLQSITTHNIFPSICQLGPLVANNFARWRSHRIGDGRIFLRPLRLISNDRYHFQPDLSRETVTLIKINVLWRSRKILQEYSN